jgi:hypothetical protein
MTSINVKTAITLLIVGSVTFVILIPLYCGKVKPNPIYGIRVRKAFESEDNWYRINKYGSAVLMYWAAALMTAGIICLYLSPQFVLSVAKVSFISIIIPIILIMQYAKK